MDRRKLRQIKGKIYIAIEDRNEKEMLTTVNRNLMEHAIEHIKTKKGNGKLLQKINVVRKSKGVMLPHDLLGEKGR